MRYGKYLLLTALILIASSSMSIYAQTTPPKIVTRLALASARVQRGRTVNALLTLEIPAGYHVNAHEPLSKFALATKIQVQAPDGIKVGPITYPKAIVRRFSFTDDRLGVYENRAVIEIRLFVPANQPKQSGQLKAVLNYQSCSNEVCFPPEKREASVLFSVS